MNMFLMMMAKLLSSSRSAVRALSFFDHGGVVSAIFCGYGYKCYLLVILLNDLISGM